MIEGVLCYEFCQICCFIQAICLRSGYYSPKISNGMCYVVVLLLFTVTDMLWHVPTAHLSCYMVHTYTIPHKQIKQYGVFITHKSLFKLFMVYIQVIRQESCLVNI